MKRLLTGAAALAFTVFTIGLVASAARADTITHPVGSAGSVTFSADGGALAFVSAEATEGWTYSVDRQDGRHLKVTFRSTTGAEAEFEAELEDGELVLAGEAEGSTSTSSGGSTSTTSGGSTSTTMAETTSTTAGSTTSTTSGSTSTTMGESQVDPYPATFAAGPAGSVTVLVIGDKVSFLSVQLNDGWTHRIDHAAGSHVEVEFRSTDGTEVEFKVDAELRVRVEVDKD